MTDIAPEAEMIKNRLEELSAELSLHSSRLRRAADSADVMASDTQAITVQHTRDVRRGEFYMVREISERERVNRVLEDLRRYISVLDENRVPNHREKSKILWLRYAHGLEWRDICQRIYGTQPDYPERQDYYRRRAYRRHEQALSEIWAYFGAGRRER